MTTLVWYKRDLRVHDHGPLHAAALLDEPVIALYVIEPEYWQQPDTSARQWGFIDDSLRELQNQLRRRGSDLLVMTGPVTGVLAQLKAEHGINRVFSHYQPAFRPRTGRRRLRSMARIARTDNPAVAPGARSCWPRFWTAVAWVTNTTSPARTRR